MYSVNFTPEAYKKMWAYINNVQNEVSGFGRVRVDDDTDSIIVDDIILLPQKVTGATTELDMDGVEEWSNELIRQGGDPSVYRLWWHSHYNFGVFWSGTDQTTIKDLDNEQNVDNWWLSIVGNHKGEYKARIDVFKPFRHTIEDVEISVLEEEDEEYIKVVKEEIKEKVKTEPVNTGRVLKVENNWGNRAPYDEDDNYYKGNDIVIQEFPFNSEDKNKDKTSGVLSDDEQIQVKILRLSGDEQKKGFYYSQWLVGQFEPLDYNEMIAWGDRECFMWSAKDYGYIPKPPKCKWYRRYLLQQSKLEIEEVQKEVNSLALSGGN